MRGADSREEDQSVQKSQEAPGRLVRNHCIQPDHQQCIEPEERPGRSDPRQSRSESGDGQEHDKSLRPDRTSILMRVEEQT